MCEYEPSPVDDLYLTSCVEEYGPGARPLTTLRFDPYCFYLGTICLWLENSAGSVNGIMRVDLDRTQISELHTRLGDILKHMPEDDQ